MAKRKAEVIIETTAKGTPALKGQTKAVKEQTKALKQQGKATKTTEKRARSFHQRQEKGVIGVANQTKSFSKMAQTMDGGGAGGLVRAYALLAANVFALSMAFGILSRSAQVDTLTQAMERLEVVSGKAIRGLARDLQEASGYGMDFADSMRATSLALSAGFDSSTVQELAEVARNASVSLGRNMADGLDRIFRGVIKVEPELLDEIGLFVRVREAAARYASELGVSAAELTEFQRRQAFANEALRQGKEKFADFGDIETDPYSILAAKFSDIAQSLMSMLNKVIVPFINLLMSSKAILMGVFLGMAAVLLNKAIPAMGIMNRTAKENAQLATEAHNKLLNDIGIETKVKLEASIKDHKTALQAIQDNKDVAASRKAAITGSGKFGMGKTQGGKQAEIDYKAAVKSNDIIKQKTALQAKYSALEKSSIYNKSRGNKDAVQAIGREKAAITKVITKLDEEILHTKEIVRLNKQLETSLVGQGTLMDRKEIKLANKELTTASLATVTNTAETKGMSAAWGVFRGEITKVKAGLKGTSSISKTTTMAMFRLKGAFSIAAVGAQNLMMALGPIMMLVSILTPAIMGLMKWMGFFSEESKAINEAQKDLEEQTTALGKKLEHQREIYRDLGSTSLNWLDAMLAQKIGIMEVLKSLEKLEEAEEDWAKNSEFIVKQAEERWQAIVNIWTREHTRVDPTKSLVDMTEVKSGPFIDAWSAQLDGILGDPQIYSKKVTDYLNEVGANIDNSQIFTSTGEGTDIDAHSNAIVKAQADIASYQEEITKVRMKDSKASEHVLRKMIADSRAQIKLHTTQMGDLSRKRAKVFIQEGLSREKLQVLLDREIAGEKNLASVREGAKDALREYRDKFIEKTDVDKPLASFSQLISALNMESEKMVATNKAVEESLKAIVQEESAIFQLMSKDRQNAFILAMGFIKGVDDAPDIFNIPNLELAESILLKQQREYANIQKIIVRNKQILKNISSIEKLIKNLRKESFEAVKLSYELEKRKKDVLLAQERITVRQALIAGGISESIAKELFDTGRIDDLMDHLAAQGLATANSHSLIVNLLQLQNVEFEVQMATATRSFRQQQETAKLHLNRLKIQEKLNALQLEGFKLQQQLNAFEARGTTQLSPLEEITAIIQAEKVRQENADERRKWEEIILNMKYEIIEQEWAIIAAKRQDTAVALARANKAEARGRGPQDEEALEKWEASWGIGFNKAIQDAMDKDYTEGWSTENFGEGLRGELEIIRQTQMNQADAYAVALRTKIGEALTQSFSTNIMNANDTNIAKMLDQLDIAGVFGKILETTTKQITAKLGSGAHLIAEKMKLEAQKKAAPLTPEQAERLEAVKAQIKLIEEAWDAVNTQKARTELQQYHAAFMNFANSVRELSPGGEFAATFAEFTVSFSAGFQNMGEAMQGFQDRVGMEDADDPLNLTQIEADMKSKAEKFKFIANAISGVASILAAASQRRVGAIDNEIAAEKKRDGKSKQSLALIKKMEQKKEAIQRKAFNMRKKMLIAETIMNTAAGVMATMKDGWQMTPLAAMIMVMGAMQLAIISGMSYEGGAASQDTPSVPAKIEVGKRTNKVDVSQRASAGELAYLRGERGIGTTATNFLAEGGAAGLRKGYAGGKRGMQGFLVGERGPELMQTASPFNVVPSYAMGGSAPGGVISFTINAIDAVGVEEVLMEQQGNIISMIRSAANDYGEEFLEAVNTDTYGEPRSPGGVDY